MVWVTRQLLNCNHYELFIFFKSVLFLKLIIDQRGDVGVVMGSQKSPPAGGLTGFL
jgi:hypothetical protein